MEEDKMIEKNNHKEENIKTEPQLEKKTENLREENKKNEEFRVTKTFVEKPKKIFAITMCIIILVAILVLSTGFAIININNLNIVHGVSIRGIEIGGLSKEQASQKLSEILNEEIGKEINLKIDGETYSIVPTQFEVSFKIEDTMETAYKIGKDRNIFVSNYKILETLLKGKDIELEISYNEKALDNLLKGINAKLPNAVMDYIYSVEDNELIITKGKAGNAINIENTKEILLKRIKSGNYEDIELEVEYREPEGIDIQKIYEEVHTEPKNAYFIKEPFQLFPHENGIDFDIEEAKEILKEDKEEYVIKLEVIKPEILTKDLGTEAFSDLLSWHSTKYDELNKSRTTNLKLATGKINGVIVMPGEIFSYNKTLGKRTAEAGYKEAAGYAGGKVVQMIGGGICQVSSTLYDAVVFANLEIVERHNHMFITSYAGAGEDATVSYGSLDFKFKNNRNYPIVIKATAKSGISKVEIYGIKEETEYDIKINTKVLSYIPFSVIYEDDDTLEVGQEKVEQYGANGCKCVSYKVVSLNGVEKSRELLYTDTYSPMNKIIRRGTKVVETTEETVETNTNPVVPEAEQTPSVEPEKAPGILTPEIPVETPEATQPEITPTTPVTPSTSTPEVDKKPKPETTNPEEEQTEIITSANPGGTTGGEM